MPRPTDDTPRVLGPTWIPSRERWRVVSFHTPTADRPKDRQSTFHYRTEDEANDVADVLRQNLIKITLEMAIDAYEKYLQDKETIGYDETIRRMRAFFPDLTMLIGRVTPARGKKWYDAFRERLRPDGQTISVAYHRATLINARSMFTFCVEEMQWLRENPLAKVKGLGKRKSGKRKPTGNELRAWYTYTWSRVEAGDRTALGLMMAFSMALRSSDITRRLVRDVDLDGTQLIVEGGKSEKSNEPRIIPDRLQPFVRQLVAGRNPLEPLFARSCKGRLLHLTRRWLEQGMERTCEKAAVPYFCPHTLKGVSGTVLAKRGAAANVIMDHLSHEESSTTFKHYVDRSLVDQAQAEQAFKVIAGGKK